jgi:hypothetical protein
MFSNRTFTDSNYAKIWNLLHGFTIDKKQYSTYVKLNRSIRRNVFTIIFQLFDKLYFALLIKTEIQLLKSTKNYEKIRFV